MEVFECIFWCFWFFQPVILEKFWPGCWLFHSMDCLRQTLRYVLVIAGMLCLWLFHFSVREAAMSSLYSEVAGCESSACLLFDFQRAETVLRMFYLAMHYLNIKENIVLHPPWMHIGCTSRTCTVYTLMWDLHFHCLGHSRPKGSSDFQVCNSEFRLLESY